MFTNRAELLGAAIMVSAAGCASHPVAAPQPARAPLAESSAAWSAIDLDHDGFVSLRELKTQGAVALIQDLAMADTNGDGRLSVEEWNRWWPRMDVTPHSPTQVRLNRPSIGSGSATSPH